ncbi:MAG: A/G-specific adenine glycosylase [Candidatus Velthaea sp.]
MIDAAADLLTWYAVHGRSHLPWRRTRDAYHVVVSEVMLQQTQVDRVVPIFDAFIARFPTFRSLADAAPGDVVRAWRGLGYNSRAVRLQRLARAVIDECGGALPRARDALLALPGVGPYTASAVRAFAYDENEAAVDTNVRRVVHRTLFGVEYPPRVGARDLAAAAAAAVPPQRGHDWNSAMMDLGASICTARAPKCLLCPLRRRCAAAPVDAAALARLAGTFAKKPPQEALPFEHSRRFLRGRIIERLRDARPDEYLSLTMLRRELRGVVPGDRLFEIPAVVDALAREGIVSASDRGIALRAL